MAPLEGFGEAIRRQRRRLGWSQSDLAEKAGVSQVSVNRWENGHRLPDGVSFEKLLDGLGLSLYELAALLDRVRDEEPAWGPREHLSPQPVPDNPSSEQHAIAPQKRQRDEADELQAAAALVTNSLQQFIRVFEEKRRAGETPEQKAEPES